jgi:hypothetical protein
VLDYPKLGRRFLMMPGKDGTRFFELKESIKPFGRADRT